MSEGAGSLVADLAGIRIVVNEVKTGQQVSRQRGMSYINSCIQHCDTHRLSIAAGTAIDRVSLSKMDRLWGPLSGVVWRIADAPTIANTPAITAALRWFLNKVWLSKQYATVALQLNDTIFDAPAVRNSQPVNCARAKLIQRIGIERVLRSDTREVCSAR